jgi:hypothetical protein
MRESSPRALKECLFETRHLMHVSPRGPIS